MPGTWQMQKHRIKKAKNGQHNCCPSATGCMLMIQQTSCLYFVNFDSGVPEPAYFLNHTCPRSFPSAFPLSVHRIMELLSRLG